MSRVYIPGALKFLIFERADNRCEYCLISVHSLIFGAQCDHIISIKHGGPTTADNLCLACLPCNLNKGSDIATILTDFDQLHRLFNPRNDIWTDHFSFEKGVFNPISDIGAATIKILQLNNPDRVMRRKILSEIGDYPF